MEKKKNILLALKRHHPLIISTFREYAIRAGWELEVTLNWIPKGWYGDGLAVDGFSWEDLSKRIPTLESTCIVSREFSDSKKPLLRTVLNDSEAEGKLAFNYFKDKGYRNYAIITEGTWKHDSTARFAKFAEDEGFRVKKLIFPDKYIGQQYVDSISKVKRFIKSLPKPCAVFTSYQPDTTILYRGCKDAGINIPEEIAVLSPFDDPTLNMTFIPNISALAGRNRQIGLTMARILDDLMNRIDLPKDPVMIEPEGIIERKSTNILAIEDPPLSSAIHFAMENFDTNIGVIDMAENAGLSEQVFRNRFQKILSKTPREFLRSIRMDKCKKLLISTKDTLTEIAQQTGYGSSMSLSLAFKNEFGMTPGKYRNQHTL